MSQHDRDMADAAADTHHAELDAWAKQVVGRPQLLDSVRERDLYLEMLAEEVNICVEALEVARAAYAQVKNWRPDETPRADRDLPGFDRRLFGRDDDGARPVEDFRVRWPA